MFNLTKIAVDAMGGDGSPKKIIDGIIHNHKSNNQNFFIIFGNKNEIEPYINDKIAKEFYKIIHTENSVKSTDSCLYFLPNFLCVLFYRILWQFYH